MQKIKINLFLVALIGTLVACGGNSDSIKFPVTDTSSVTPTTQTIVVTSKCVNVNSSNTTYSGEQIRKVISDAGQTFETAYCATIIPEPGTLPIQPRFCTSSFDRYYAFKVSTTTAEKLKNTTPAFKQAGSSYQLKEAGSDINCER